jgi:hypothetical protein
LREAGQGDDTGEEDVAPQLVFIRFHIYLRYIVDIDTSLDYSRNLPKHCHICWPNCRLYQLRRSPHPGQPFMMFDVATKTTDIIMFNSRNLGALIVDEKPHVKSWDEPQYSIQNLGIEESYGFGVLNEGQAIAVAKNVKFVRTRCRHQHVRSSPSVRTMPTSSCLPGWSVELLRRQHGWLRQDHQVTTHPKVNALRRYTHNHQTLTSEILVKAMAEWLHENVTMKFNFTTEVCNQARFQITHGLLDPYLVKTVATSNGLMMELRPVEFSDDSGILIS